MAVIIIENMYNVHLHRFCLIFFFGNIATKVVVNLILREQEYNENKGMIKLKSVHSTLSYSTDLNLQV